MTLEHKTDYVATAQQQLIHDLRKPTIEALLETWLDGAQQLENALQQLYGSLFVKLAEGAALDQLGTLVGQPRQGRTDTTYRAWIAARIQINRSGGAPDDAITMLALLDPGATMRVLEYPPASYVLEVLELTAINGDDLHAIVDQVRPAGVAMFLVWTAEADALTLGDAPNEVIEAGTGLADTGAAVGGVFMGVV